MSGKFCGKTYYSTIGGQDVIVWCDQEPGHDGDCGPFVHPPQGVKRWNPGDDPRIWRDREAFVRKQSLGHQPTEPSIDDRIQADIDAGSLPREWLTREPTDSEGKR